MLNMTQCKESLEKNVDNHNIDEKTVNFIQRLKKIHGEKFIYDKIVYIRSGEKVIVTCSHCKKDASRIAYHLLKPKSKCVNCLNEEKTKNCLKKFLEKAPIIHKNRYIYDISEIQGYTKDKIKIQCPVHSWFYQYGPTHLEGKGCPKCALSKGEKEIRSWLMMNAIPFEPQKKFEECRLKQALKFDFFVPCLNLIIEFNGLQHEKPCFGNASFERTRKSDKIKENYCVSKNINLLVIGWKNLRNIDEILEFIFEGFDISKNLRPFPNCGPDSEALIPKTKRKPGAANIGKVLSSEHLQKVKSALKLSWVKRKQKNPKPIPTVSTTKKRVLSEKHTENFLKGARENYKKIRKPVIQKTLDGVFIKEYDSIVTATHELGLENGSTISNVCHGKKKTCRGFLWEFKNKQEID